MRITDNRGVSNNEVQKVNTSPCAEGCVRAHTRRAPGAHGMTAGIDTTFDFHSDSDGRDPDKYSQKLLEYHQLLWNKELPSGARFNLRPEPGAYLVHRSALGVLFLASEAFTTRLRGKAAGVIRSIPTENLPRYIGYTVGSTLVFPGNRIGRKMTINGVRGFHPRIADRPDLTLECIRRCYLGELPNPLAAPLARYEASSPCSRPFAGTSTSSCCRIF